MKKMIICNFGEEIIVVPKTEIMEILFHRGRMLLLDRVELVGNKVVGEFMVPAEICEGHEPMPGMPVMRGVEIAEMAFQLFAVFASKNPELAAMGKGKVCAARGITGVRFSGFVRPTRKLIMETMANVGVEEMGGMLRVESNRMIARVGVGGRKVCTIDSVALGFFDHVLINRAEQIFGQIEGQ